MIGTGTRQIYTNLTTTGIKELLYTEGALLVAIHTNTNFQLYTTGIFNGCPANAADNLNHAVLLIGYDDTENVWIIKNSWDTTWG